MDKFHREIITALTPELQSDIVPLPSFYAKLLAKGIFTDEMVQQIQAQKTESEQNLRMLTLLKKRAKVFHKFCEILEDTSYKHLAKLLRDEETRRREVTTPPSEQMQEFFSKNLATNRHLSQNDKQVICNNLVTKDEFMRERRSLNEKDDENKRLNNQVKPLQNELSNVNDKLNISLKVIKGNNVEMDELNQKIKELQAKIKELSQEKMSLEDKLNRNYNGSPRIVNSLDQEPKDQVWIADAKDEEISKLKEELDIKQSNLEGIRIQFESHKRDHEEKIKKINEKMQAVTDHNPNDDNLPIDTKHMVILHMNMEHVENKIAALQEDLFQAHNTIRELETEQQTACEIRGFDRVENNQNIDTIELSFINKLQTETEDQKIKINYLKKKLKEAKTEKSNLQRQLDKLKINEELMKQNLKTMKKKYLDLRGRMHERRGSSAGESHSSGGDIVQLPDISVLNRFADLAKNLTLKKSPSEPVFKDTFPDVIRVAHPQNSLTRPQKSDKYHPRSRHLSIDRLPPLDEDSGGKRMFEKTIKRT
ncbi:unnamed protein product [Owenia fusiformis]|uniref:Uncharacterized protein n=1 Tax=Owenia fusiformis TaxID=6347 RepID=A0A8J1UJC3_OWEFU|nr:unnamed protein product [Owenia fusiformis]